MSPIDPISHAIGQLQSTMEGLRLVYDRAESAADVRHDRVMMALEHLEGRVAALETMVKAHREKLEKAESLVESVEMLRARGAGALFVISAIWLALVGAAAWFKTEIVRWIVS